MTPNEPLYIQTPTLTLRRPPHRTLHLKLEALQPSGSFKARGLGVACARAAEGGAARFISSSGGNAGLAVARAGRLLQRPVTLFVPTSTAEAVQQRLRDEGAEVRVVGAAWDEAHAAALDEQRLHADTALIHPFDHPDVWEGNATLVDELAAQLAQAPDLVVLSVGGGGLLCGVLQGMHRVGWQHVPLLAVETFGAASFHHATRLGRVEPIERIDSVARSLGARAVAQEALDWTRRHPITPHRISDAQALQGCVFCADHLRLLVEPACGAALYAALHPPEPLAHARHVAVVVCGGVATSAEEIAAWRRQVS